MRIAVKIAYDGKYFHGYARQPLLRTVEGEILEKLEKNCIINDLNSAFFRSASRTDKGVSALGNVIAFNVQKDHKDLLEFISNEERSIIAYAKKIVNDDFNPRHAKRRVYRYYLKRNDIDLDLFLKTAAIFTGTHDFSNFARIEKNKDPKREIENIIISEGDGFLIIDFFAETFLWHQIRRIISGIVNMNKGKFTIEEIKEGLEKPDVKMDFGLAPAEPLILVDVDYGFEFEDVNNNKYYRYIENRILNNLDIAPVKN